MTPILSAMFQLSGGSLTCSFSSLWLSAAAVGGAAAAGCLDTALAVISTRGDSTFSGAALLLTGCSPLAIWKGKTPFNVCQTRGSSMIYACHLMQHSKGGFQQDLCGCKPN